MERPDPGEVVAPADFARMLKALKWWSGDPSLRRLAKETGIPAATLSDAMNPGKALPQLGLVRALVPRLDAGADLGGWENAWRRARAAALSRRSPVSVVPRQLPADVYGFVGRDDLMHRLDTVVSGEPHPPAAVLSALTGSGGVGKTAIAVHWAHRVADRFPDGQLYTDLAGYGPGEPRSTGEVLAGFLRALGTPPADIPGSLDDRAALYRSMIAEKRVLVVCDNALDSAQVRPLLPSGSGSFALVTTRSAFTGIQVRDGAVRIPVDRLTTEDARRLAGGLIGDRARAEPDAAERLVELCARLPLAIRIAACQVMDRPQASLAEVVAEMDAEGIEFFADADDAHADLVQLFSWSLRRLPADTRELFGLLGLHPGRHLELSAVAALAGESPQWARRQLDVLSNANLIDESGVDRYAMHDLLQSYADTLAAAADPRAAGPACRRLADYYLHTVANAKDAAESWDVPDQARPLPGDGKWARRFTAAASAGAWLKAEVDNLVLLVAHWRTAGLDGHVAWASTLLWRSLTLHGYYDEALAIHGSALESAKRDGDVSAMGAAEFRLGDVRWRTGDLDKAADWFGRALEHKKQAGHREGVVHSLSGLGCVYLYMRQYTPARDAFTECLDTAREIGSHESVIVALHNLAEVHMKLSQWDEAVCRSEAAVRLAESANRRAELVSTLAALGRALARQGRFGRSAAVVSRAHELAGEIESQELLADALCAKGVLLGAKGSRAEARGHLQRAWRIFSRLGLVAGQTEAAELLAEFAD